MEAIIQKRAELKKQEKEVKRRMALKNKADKYKKKLDEMVLMNPVMYYYRRFEFLPSWEKFESNEPITNEDYYLELFDYLENGRSSYSAGIWFNIKQKKRCIGYDFRPTLQEVIDICVLFDIPFDDDVLTETYNENVYQEPYYQCEICYEEKPVNNDDGSKTFCSFQKRCIITDRWVKSCSCKILVCVDCASKINPRCCPLCRTPFQAVNTIDEKQLKDHFL